MADITHSTNSLSLDRGTIGSIKKKAFMHPSLRPFEYDRARGQDLGAIADCCPLLTCQDGIECIVSTGPAIVMHHYILLWNETSVQKASDWSAVEF